MQEIILPGAVKEKPEVSCTGLSPLKKSKGDVHGQDEGGGVFRLIGQLPTALRSQPFHLDEREIGSRVGNRGIRRVGGIEGRSVILSAELILYQLFDKGLAENVHRGMEQCLGFFRMQQQVHPDEVMRPLLGNLGLEDGPDGPHQRLVRLLCFCGIHRNQSKPQFTKNFQKMKIIAPSMKRSGISAKKLTGRVGSEASADRGSLRGRSPFNEAKRYLRKKADLPVSFFVEMGGLEPPSKRRTRRLSTRLSFL